MTGAQPRKLDMKTWKRLAITGAAIAAFAAPAFADTIKEVLLDGDRAGTP